MSTSTPKRKAKPATLRTGSIRGKPMSGAELKSALESLDMTQYDAAAVFRYPQGSIARWATGTRAIPALEILVRLMLAKKVTRADIDATMGR
jgi:hypothetical protein